MTEQSDETLRERARAQYGSDEIEVDDDAQISRAQDGGAWVQAWVYIDTTDNPEEGRP